MNVSLSLNLKAILAVTLVTINAIGVFGIVSSRRDAEMLALQELRLQGTANALSLEAALASRRADLAFLSQSSPLTNAPVLLTTRDPITTRWRRLDIESSLLMFLEAHPEVERLVIRDSRGVPLVASGRRDGAPVLLRAEEYQKPAAAQSGYMVGSWPLGSSGGAPGILEAVHDVPRLLRIAVPGMSSQFT